jgi:hypothetical protein
MLKSFLTVWENGQVTFDVVRDYNVRRSVLWFGLYVPLSPCINKVTSKITL